MSKARKIFSRIILFTFFSFVFISCKNLFNSGNDEVIIHKRKAKVSVSADFGKTRTVLPTSFNGTEQGYTWNLLGKKSTEEESKNLATWKDEDNKTSYQLLNETKDILIDEGTWNFELTVSKLDTTGNTVYVLYSKIENVTIKSGVENSLHFSMEEATSSNLGETAPLAKGVINFTLNFPSGIVNDVQVSLYDINVLEKPVFDQTWPDYLNYGKIQFVQGEYAPGYYLLKIQLKQNIIDDQQVTINTYACIIRVSPGLKSEGEYTLESLAQMFNLNYELNYDDGESLGDVATTVTYNEYTSFELPTPTKEGYDFVGWYTDAELTNPVVLDENGKYRITQDTTLYPKWLKSYTFVLGDQDDTPSQVDTTFANYVPETKTIEVVNPDNSGTVWSYYIKTQEEPNKPFFLEGKNYKIFLEMKSNSNSDTVVGIQAGNTDMFFTVGENWTECSFETGFIKKALSAGKNGITIGTGLSSSVSYRNLIIEEISSDDGLPSLVFDISRNAIETYLGKTDKATKIIDVSKLEENAGYNITINAPLSYKEATGATVQDVKLHLRSYGTETGANRVSFRVDNLGNNSFYTSVIANTASEKSTAWNNGTKQIDPGKFGSYEIDFPNYVANDELIVDVITSSEDAISEPIELQISEFAVTKDFPDNTTPFANKIFAIQIDGVWTKIDDGAPISKEVTINKDGNIKFDVGLFNGFNDEDGSPSDWDDVTRFLYTDENIPEGLTYTKEDGSEPKFIITNNSNEEKTVKISLNENYEVVIEEVSNIVTTWDELNYRISNTSISEIVITEDLTATSTITVSKPVKIISDKNVRITRGNSIDGANFEDSFFRVESAGNLELAGTENITITLDGGNANESPILATAPLITSSGNLTLTNCTLQNNKNTSTTPGGAIYISAGTFTMNGGIIGKEITGSDASTGKQSWQDAATETNHSNYAYAGGGGIYVASGDVTINGGKISYNYTRNLGNDCLGKTPENTAAGGGISIVSGSLSLINSEVSYNSGYQGGGIRCYNDNTSNAGTLTLNKTLIKGNTSNPYNGSSFGGGLMVKNFNVTFEETTESTIEQNYSGDGGALFLENTTSTLKNITIQNNSFNDNGYKYGSEMLLWDSAVISIASNTVNISNNEPADRKGIFINNSTDKLKLSGDISLASPIYLYFENENSSPAVTVAGTLSEDTVATIKLLGDCATEGKLVLEAEGEVTLTEEIIAKFTLGNEEFYIDTNGKLAKINTELNLITELSSITANAYGVKQLPSGVYYLDGDLILEVPVYISNGDVVIYAKENASITGSFSNDCFFSVINCSLTFGKDELTDTTLTIDAGKKSDENAVLNAGSGGTLNLKNNVICTGATNQSFITTANGTVNISGGKITENHGASPVINVTGGTVNITGGEISNNSCVDFSGYCSGILVSSGTLNIDGSTITISNNTYGISSDDLENQGASIYNKGGTVTVLGNALEQNTKFTQNIVNGEIEDVPSGGGIAYNVGEAYYDGSNNLLGYIFDVGDDYIKIANPNPLTSDDEAGLQWCESSLSSSLTSITDGLEMKNAITSIGITKYPLYAALPSGDWYVPTISEFELMLQNITNNQIDFEYSTFWTSTIKSNEIYYYCYESFELQPCDECSDCLYVMKINF